MNQVGARSKYRKYDHALLEQAASLVRSKAMSLSRAAREFNVPKATLHDKVNVKYETDKVGAKPVLTDHEEQRIVEWVLHMSKIGYGRTKQELTATIKKILDDQGRTTKFKDNRPGRDWLRSFFKRNPSLTLRSTLQLGKERAVISKEKVQNWFHSVTDYINNEVKDPDLLKDPSRIYNADESGFSLSVKNSQVIGPKGAPVVYNFGNSDKSQLTIMAAVSAVGHYIPPMIVFPGQRFSYNPLDGFEEAVLGRSESGWMDAELFCNWLEKVFIPAINERNVKKPVLLFIDGHSTHVTLEASDICVKNNIEMFCLLEHASHVLQPLDLKFFGILKQSWKQSVREWQAQNVGQFVTKKSFAKVFKGAWEKSATVEAAVKGFQEAGLFPLNPSAVTKSVKLQPSQVFKTCMIDKSQKKGTTADSTNTESQKKETTADSTNTESVTETQQHETLDESLEESSIKITSIPEVQSSPANENETVEETNGKPRCPELLCSPVKDKVSANSATLAAQSPLSKHLTFPTASSKTIRRGKGMPKAITGKDYRILLNEKKMQKEKEEKAKAERKEERLRKRKEREEEKEQKQIEKKLKTKIKDAEKEKKKQEKIERALKEIVDSDSDDQLEVNPKNCYACEKPFDNYLMCTNCGRKFHPECVADELIDDLEFECKYC